MWLNRFTRIFLFLLSIKVSLCQRKLMQGSYAQDDKRYMAYFVKSNFSKPSYDAWLCGGAIISSTKILTAAACLVELNNIYAIAGYKFYVNGLDIHTDECTRRWKQKVVKICVHKDYTLNHSSPVGWLRLDVGVATVEKPYDFNDLSIRLHCSYVPAPIAISYQMKETKPGTNVLLLGWGHSGLRQPQDLTDRNSPFLRVAVSKIQYRRICNDSFNIVKGYNELIHGNIICVRGHGSIDINGDLVTEDFKAENNKCSFRRNVNGTKSIKCEEDYDLYSDLDGELYFDNDLRKHALKGKKKNNSNGDRLQKMRTDQINANIKRTRRQAICQNDHGGPLVTWLGTSEVVIGVALTSEYSNPDLCEGPSIFYSTHAAKDWLQCLLAVDEIMVKLCAQQAILKGYDLDGKYVSWDNDNVSYNFDDTTNITNIEKYKTIDVKLRQQVPINSIASLQR